MSDSAGETPAAPPDPPKEQDYQNDLLAMVINLRYCGCLERPAQRLCGQCHRAYEIVRAFLWNRDATERQHHAARTRAEVEKACAAERTGIAFDIAENPNSEWTTELRADLAAARAEIARLTENRNEWQALTTTAQAHATEAFNRAGTAEASLLALQQQMEKIQTQLTITGGLDPENCVEEIRCLQAEIESDRAQLRARKAPNQDCEALLRQALTDIITGDGAQVENLDPAFMRASMGELGTGDEITFTVTKESVLAAVDLLASSLTGGPAHE